ncbi:hypothetical protein FORC13_p023 (plasmid) [Bacillus cereus]|nr:hypothetical protein FORC13_p023 [Bacillus cereus]
MAPSVLFWRVYLKIFSKDKTDENCEQIILERDEAYI